MTEAQWQQATSSFYFLMRAKQFVARTSTHRKSRLFAAACCRKAWHLLPPAFRDVVDEIERRADAGRGPVTTSRLFRRALEELERLQKANDQSLHGFSVRMVADTVLRAAKPVTSKEEMSEVIATEHLLLAVSADPDIVGDSTSAQAAILRDIFGNPFRPVAFAPEWRTDTAVTLARQMYESREFSAMPILADALQDAGCDNEDILTHCREPGTHVRGCWVVDRVLGKE